jgi:hypothetical protein
VGHDVASRVLHDVPAFLSPKPTFEEVARVFCERSFGVEIRGPVASAFNQVGLPSCVEL